MSKPYPSHQLEFNNSHKEGIQTSHQILSDNISYYAYLELMINKLAVEQKEDLFSTQHALDQKPNRPKLIQEHINRDKIKKSKVGNSCQF